MNSLTARKDNAQKVILALVLALALTFAAVVVSANPAFAAAGIDTLFNTANGIANAVMKGFQGLVLTVAVAAGVYCAIRWFMASDAKEGQTYKNRIITIILVALVAFLFPKIIEWTNTLAGQINL